MERYRDQLKREDRRAGGVIAALFNSNRTAETDPLHEWWDFFAEWKPEVKEQTEEEMLAAMLQFTKSTNEGLSH